MKQPKFPFGSKVKLPSGTLIKVTDVSYLGDTFYYTSEDGYVSCREKDLSEYVEPLRIEEKCTWLVDPGTNLIFPAPEPGNNLLEKLLPFKGKMTKITIEEIK